jgi:hypothetical protein
MKKLCQNTIKNWQKILAVGLDKNVSFGNSKCYNILEIA